MNIGQRIKNERARLGLTQDELAIRAGYTGKSMICRIENGKNKPSYESLHRIAVALGTTEGALLGYDLSAQLEMERERLAEIKKNLEHLTGAERAEQESAIAIMEESIEDQELALSILAMGKKESPPPAKRDELSVLIDSLTDQQKQEALQFVRYLAQQGRE